MAAEPTTLEAALLLIEQLRRELVNLRDLEGMQDLETLDHLAQRHAAAYELRLEALRAELVEAEEKNAELRKRLEPLLMIPREPLIRRLWRWLNR